MFKKYLVATPYGYKEVLMKVSDGSYQYKLLLECNKLTNKFNVISKDNSRNNQFFKASTRDG